MKSRLLLTTLGLAFTPLLLPVTAFAAEPEPEKKEMAMPPMPEPQKEHAWLQKFVGSWESESEITMEPGKPPMKTKSQETVRSLGGFWIVSEGKGDMMGMPFHSVLTLGYDPEQKQYVGTWVDSVSSRLWHYTGKVSEAGVLTLESEGPCPLRGGEITQFRETVEFKGADHRVFTSEVKGPDGKWLTIVTMKSHRAGAAVTPAAEAAK